METIGSSTYHKDDGLLGGGGHGSPDSPSVTATVPKRIYELRQQQDEDGNGNTSPEYR